MEATAAGPDLSRQAVCRLPSDYELFDITAPISGRLTSWSQQVGHLRESPKSPYGTKTQHPRQVDELRRGNYS